METFLTSKNGNSFFPIETTRRNPRVRQPVERDVVEHVALCKLVLGLSCRGPTQRRGDRPRRLAFSREESSSALAAKFKVTSAVSWGEFRRLWPAVAKAKANKRCQSSKILRQHAKKSVDDGLWA
jgi:hypothetical protein